MNDPYKTQAFGSDPNRTQMGSPPAADPNRTVMGDAPSLNATQTIKPVQCPICKTYNPAGVMYCVDCGLIFESALPADAFGAPKVEFPVLVEIATGREHPLRPGETRIGREGDLQLADAQVSRRHARVLSEGGRLTLEDLGSTNGTKLNGEALGPNEPRALAEGDTLRFGGVEFKLSFPGEAHRTASIPSRKTEALAVPPRVEVPEAKLVAEGREWPLKKGANLFGRKAENAVQIADPYVSGRHGEIEVGETEVWLTDLGSTNGTWVNEARLSPNQKLSIGPDDVIRLGKLELRVVRLDPETATE